MNFLFIYQHQRLIVHFFVNKLKAWVVKVESFHNNLLLADSMCVSTSHSETDKYLRRFFHQKFYFPDSKLKLAELAAV